MARYHFEHYAIRLLNVEAEGLFAYNIWNV